MFCKYMRHIDLLAVYEQLDDFNQGALLNLANIPMSISFALADLLEERAEATIEDIYGHSSWRNLPPIDVATAVGRCIEHEIENLAATLPPEAAPPASRRLSAPKWLDRFGMFTAGAVSSQSPNYWQMHSLLICQYDCACWLYKRKDYDGAMSVLGCYFGAVGVASALTSCYGANRSDQQRVAAAARHQTTNQQRKSAVVDWEAYGNKVSSMAAFARSRHKDFGVTERTLYEWIRNHRKTKT